MRRLCLANPFGTTEAARMPRFKGEVADGGRRVTPPPFTLRPHGVPPNSLS